jgi:hypothetical protein
MVKTFFKHLTKEYETMKNIVIVDVDGTLTKVGSRVLCLKKSPPDWDEFYSRCGEDKPVNEIIRMVNLLCLHYQIVICTGRRESCRAVTEQWFTENGFVEFGRMLMRADGDIRHDTIIKPEMLEIAGIKPEEIAFVLEDRKSMVEKWREMGIICLQVANGDF